MTTVSERNQHVADLMTRVKFVGCSLFKQTEWRVKDTNGPGVLLQLGFMRPDTHTKIEGMGYSREEFIRDDASDDAIMMTGLLLAKLISEHETMEAFTIDGIRVVNPHRSIEAHMRGEAFDGSPIATP